jgi:hypothetical protein
MIEKVLKTEMLIYMVIQLLRHASHLEHYLWGIEGEFYIDEYDMINHTINTSGGQSGSSQYIEEDN